MQTLIICIIVFLVLEFIAEKTLGGKSIGSVFQWRGSWYEISNSTRGFSIFFKKEPNEYADKESSYKCYRLSLNFF